MPVPNEMYSDLQSMYEKAICRIAELERELTQAKADGVMEFALQGVAMCRERLEGKSTEQWKVGVMDCLMAATDYANEIRNDEDHQ